VTDRLRGPRFDSLFGKREWLDPLSGHLLRRSVQGGRWPIILMYHAIDPSGGSSNWPWAVTSDRFQRQLDLLVQLKIRTLRLDQVGETSSISRAVVITFDDGYVDNHQYALPALQARGQVATWFIPSALVGQRASWVRGEGQARFLMDRGQLHDLMAAGMEIGGHGRIHTPLTELSASELADEVAGSRRELGEILGVRPSSFAYPFGRYNHRVREAVAKVGYNFACSTRPGWWDSETDPLQLRRVTVFGEDGLAVFARKLCFAANDVSWRSIARYYRSRLGLRLARR